MHLKGSPRGDAKAQVHQGDQAKVSTLLYQVLLLGISTMERDIVKIVPEKKINIKETTPKNEMKQKVSGVVVHADTIF